MPNLDPDKELLSHLPDSDSWLVLRAEGFRDVLIQDEEIREVYQWADNHLREYGEVATALVLEDEFDIEFTEPQTAIGDLIDRMRLRYMHNEGREALKAITQQYKEDASLVPKLLLRHGKELTELLTRRGETYGNGDFERAIQRYLDRATQGVGPSFGFEELDEYFHGMRGVSIYLGPPKTWKSWFMVKAHLSNAIAGKYPWLFSLELPAEETYLRTCCMMADIPWWKHTHNALSPDERKLMDEAMMALDSEGAHKIMKPPQGERSLEEMVGRAKDNGAGVVLIDQLQYVEVDGKSLGAWNKTEKYFDVLDHARNLSDEIPICFAHQFNRTTLNAEEMPVVQQAKGSSAIEETSTVVLGLWASKDMRKSGLMEIGVLAARNHNFRNWRVDVDLSKRCSFEITGVVEDD